MKEEKTNKEVKNLKRFTNIDNLVIITKEEQEAMKLLKANEADDYIRGN